MTEMMLLQSSLNRAASFNQTDLYPSGSHVVRITQVGDENLMSSLQYGEQNIASIRLRGDNNRVRATQDGVGNRLGLAIDGSGNVVPVTQIGSGHELSLEILGSGVRLDQQSFFLNDGSALNGVLEGIVQQGSGAIPLRVRIERGSP
jgi:hypothetical protein